MLLQYLLPSNQASVKENNKAVTDQVWSNASYIIALTPDEKAKNGECMAEQAAAIAAGATVSYNKPCAQ